MPTGGSERSRVTWPQHPDSADPAWAAAGDLAEAAAMADAVRVFQAKVAADPDARHEPPSYDPPTWVLPFLEAHNRAIDGEHHSCPHLHPDDVRTAIHIAVWAVGYVTCTACADLGMLDSLIGDDDRHRCSLCHTHVARLRRGILRGGHALVHFNICDPCTDSGAAGR